MAVPNLVETHINPALDGQMEENRIFRRARITKPRWNPKEWHPIYEEVVLLDCMGYKRSEIAIRMGFSEMHITNVLKTDQAAIVRKLVLARINSKAMQTIEQRLEAVTLKAMKRVEDVMNNDVLAEKNPLGIFDRAITVLRGTRKIQPETDGGSHIGKAIIVSDHQFDKLMKGTAMADEAKRLHATPEVEVSTIEDAQTP